MIAVSRKEVMSKERALLCRCKSPSPPNFLGLWSMISSGFSNWSANSQDHTLDDIFERSHSLRLMEEVLNQTLLRQYVLSDCGLLVSGMNLPPLHGPIGFAVNHN